MIGQTFGRWTVLDEFRLKGIKYCECRCECGTVRIVKACNLTSGRSKSCGCLRSEKAKLCIAANSRRRLDTVAAWGTNFDVIDNGKTYKNNKSGHKGVIWDKRLCAWKAYIYLRKKFIYLGSYHDIEGAIQAREAAEREYFAPLIEAKNALRGGVV